MFLCLAEKALVIVDTLLGLALLVENWTAFFEPLVLELHHL